jgi:ketosteroid isomerase-like protein
MRRRGLAVAVLGIFLAVSFGSLASASDRQGEGIVARTRAFLDAYAEGRSQAVLAQIDPAIVIYGSDVAEVFRGPEGVRRMIDGDQKLWRGPAKIGDMQDLSVVTSGDLAVMTFQAPFTLGSRPPVLVRFSMAWRRGKGGWRLVQSANAVPTIGQSAEALLKGGN